MRTIAFAIAALVLVGAATNSYAAQFSFDPSSGTKVERSGSIIPLAIVAIASLVGALLIALERKKAKGIWFSNSERLK